LVGRKDAVHIAADVRMHLQSMIVVGKNGNRIL
jgi:hypothetical protein